MCAFTILEQYLPTIALKHEDIEDSKPQKVLCADNIIVQLCKHNRYFQKREKLTKEDLIIF